MPGRLKQTDQVHVGMSTTNGHLNLINVLSNDPTLGTKHTSNIRLEHVQGVIDCLLSDGDPSPYFYVLCKDLAELVTCILILRSIAGASSISGRE